jgi:1,4-alpha-glucan branching enzyme
MSILKRYIFKNEICKVTFILPRYLADKAISVHIVGEFNNWDTNSTRMKMVSGKFTRTLKLSANRNYQFRYLINGIEWGNDLDADTFEPGPFGSHNSVIAV